MKQANKFKIKNLKKIKKVLDNILKICYNNNVNKKKQKTKERYRTMQKMTIANKFDEVVNFITGEGVCSMSQDEIVDFLLDRKAKSVKKVGSRKPTAKQKENEVVKAAILEGMTAEGATVTDLMARIPALEGLSNQKVSALLRQLVISGDVVKTIDGKKSLFALA